jgi:PH (Pleckstrin Homology) domain-containing protein
MGGQRLARRAGDDGWGDLAMSGPTGRSVDDRSTTSVHRVRGMSVAVWAMACFVTAYSIYALVVISQSDKPRAVPVVILVVVNTPGLAFLVRAARSGALATREGVHVRNIRRTIFVPWDEIDRFTVGSSGILPKVGVIERRNGVPIPIWGIQGPNPAVRPNNRAAERVIERLNHELSVHRSPARSTD